MEDYAFGIGILLAVAGPLLLVPVVWIVYRVLARPAVLSVMAARPGTRSAGRLALALSVLLVAAVLAVSYLPGKREFDRLCDMHAIPTVSERTLASGFYRNRLYPYEARRFLDEGGFTFVEAPHRYEQDAYVRYSINAGGELDEEMVPEPESRYGVRETLAELPHGILMTEKVVYERGPDRELARAAQVVYQGGPLSLLLGVYAMSSCPDVRSPGGSGHFMTFYNLETIALRSAEPDSTKSNRPLGPGAVERD